MATTIEKEESRKKGKKKGIIKNEGRGWQQWECGAPQCHYREFQLHPSLH